MTNNEHDQEAVARKAIKHLEKHGLGWSWELDGDPSPDVGCLIISHLIDEEVADTLRKMTYGYLMRRIAQDHPGLKSELFGGSK